MLRITNSLGWQEEFSISFCSSQLLWHSQYHQCLTGHYLQQPSQSYPCPCEVCTSNSKCLAYQSDFSFLTILWFKLHLVRRWNYFYVVAFWGWKPSNGITNFNFGNFLAVDHFISISISIETSVAKEGVDRKAAIIRTYNFIWDSLGRLRRFNCDVPISSVWGYSWATAFPAASWVLVRRSNWCMGFLVFLALFTFTHLLHGHYGSSANDHAWH